MTNIVTVTLPDIGEGVVEGEVIKWLKQEGDPLQQDEPVVIVMTDKATVELPALYPGKLVKHYFKPGEKAMLDRPLYDIEVEGEVAPPKEEETSKEIIFEKKASPKPLPSSSGEKVLATPPVRKLARDLGIDINQVSGTGEDGRVTVEDLRILRQPEEETPIVRLPTDEEQPVIGIPALMAKKMAESKRLIPHFSYFEKVNATRLIQLRQNVKQQGVKEGVRVTFMPFLIRALSLTIKKYPVINSSYDRHASKLIIHKEQNIGVAMSTKLGLIVPVLKGVQEMTLEQIIRKFNQLKQDALDGKLQSKDMKEATISLSNYGVLGSGGLWATPIINCPESAILAVNKIRKRPVVKNNELIIQDTLNLSWSFDHRIIDGDLAARVSHYFATLVQNPAPLI